MCSTKETPRGNCVLSVSWSGVSHVVNVLWISFGFSGFLPPPKNEVVGSLAMLSCLCVLGKRKKIINWLLCTIFGSYLNLAQDVTITLSSCPKAMFSEEPKRGISSSCYMNKIKKSSLFATCVVCVITIILIYFPLLEKRKILFT